MSQPKKSGSQLPKWSALVLGFGALFAAEAQAKSDLPSTPTNSQTSKQFGSSVDAVLRSEPKAKRFTFPNAGARSRNCSWGIRQRLHT